MLALKIFVGIVVWSGVIAFCVRRFCLACQKNAELQDTRRKKESEARQLLHHQERIGNRIYSMLNMYARIDPKHIRISSQNTSSGYLIALWLNKETTTEGYSLTKIKIHIESLTPQKDEIEVVLGVGSNKECFYFDRSEEGVRTAVHQSVLTITDRIGIGK